jgi:hypothetical protein
MAARQNGLSELVRFWLEARHECFIRESVPVWVGRGNSDIDFLALRADGLRLPLPDGSLVGPRLIVESKDEHDNDSRGSEFGRLLREDMQALGDSLFVAATPSRKVAFTMLKEQHFQVASSIFGSDDFDRVFVVHALADSVRKDATEALRAKRIHWVTVTELLCDLRDWYGRHERPAGLRHTLTGDLFHLLFGYCRVKPS